MTTSILLAALAASTPSLSTSALTQAVLPHDTKRYLIQFKHDISPVESPLVSGEQRIHNLRGNIKQRLTRQNTIAALLTATAAKQLATDPNIAFIEEDPVRELAHKGYTTYGVKMVQAPLVADTASSNQKVCIIDTGYDASHEDLPNGANVTGETVDTTGGQRKLGNWFEDSYGHGTHVMGTIASLGNNIGYEGILPSGQLNIHHVKIIDHPGYWRFYGSDLIAAINACDAAGATIANMSIAGWKPSEIEATAMQNAADNGMLLIAAGGNMGDTQYAYPASYNAVVSVGAIDADQNPWMFTQTNDHIELVAPGVHVDSTLPNNRYGTWDGTSTAAPHVSGVAALVWSHFPSCSSNRIREALNTSALDLGAPGRDNTFGNGVVQAQAAMSWLETNGCSEAKTCREIYENGQHSGSGMYALDFDGSGPLSAVNVYCDMDNQGGGWTQFAYHADGLPSREVTNTMDGQQYGVLSDAHWRYLVENMRDGMMFIDEFDNVSMMSKPTLDTASCRKPTDVQSLNESALLYLYINENSGCGVSGVDYSLIHMSLGSATAGTIAGASLYQISTVKFDVWPYPVDWSYGIQDELHYFIR